MTQQRFVLGVDIGQAHDYTALVVLERAESELHVRHVERLPLGMSYPDQVERVAALVGSPELAHDVLVAVDSTGVGRAVVDLLREALRPLQTPLTAITITGGSTASRDGSKWSIPKQGSHRRRPGRTPDPGAQDRLGTPDGTAPCRRARCLSGEDQRGRSRHLRQRQGRPQRRPGAGAGHRHLCRRLGHASDGGSPTSAWSRRCDRQPDRSQTP